LVNAAYVASYFAGLDVWIEEHKGLKVFPLFRWIIYDIDSTTHTLPPNSIPCAIWNPLMALFWGFCALGTLFTLSLIAKTWTAVRKRAYPASSDFEYLQQIPDITQYIRPPTSTASIKEIPDLIRSGTSLISDTVTSSASIISDVASIGGKG
jgi:hypothetical protein